MLLRHIRVNKADTSQISILKISINSRLNPPLSLWFWVFVALDGNSVDSADSRELGLALLKIFK